MRSNTCSTRLSTQSLASYELGVPEGRPIVFLQGAARAVAVWDDVAELLPDHRAICLVLPMSTIHEGGPLDILLPLADRVAEDIRTSLPGQRVPLVGTSQGALTALLVALRHSDVVGSLVLSNIQIASSNRRTLFAELRSRFSWVFEALLVLRGAESRQRVMMADINALITLVDVPVLMLSGDSETSVFLEPAKDAGPSAQNLQHAFVSGDNTWMSARPDLFVRILISWIEDGTLPDDPDIVRCGFKMLPAPNARIV